MVFVGERRRHPRVRLKLPLKYILFREKLQFARSLEFSGGGMSLHNSEYISHKTKVLIELLPPNWLDYLRIISEVVHTREHSSGDHFTIGIRFKHMLKQQPVSKAVLR